MVTIFYSSAFEKRIKKMKDEKLKAKVKKQLIKIVNNPEVGKPMKHARKGTREVYISPFRLSYAYVKNENKLIFLELYHKDEQ